MHTSFVHIVLYGLMGPAVALTTGSEPHYAAIYQRSDCEMRDVYFRFNDSTLGTMASCSWDVMNLAGSSPVSASSNFARSASSSSSSSHTFSPRQACPPGSCSDGPNTTYIVQSGDTLEKIAAMFNSGVCDIAKANNISNPDFILNGQNLTVPTKLCNRDNTSCRTKPGTRPCIPKSEGVSANYTIQGGDTFFLIGTRLNLTADSIVGVNLCADPGALQVGQVIHIPICPDCSKSCSA